MNTPLVWVLDFAGLIAMPTARCFTFVRKAKNDSGVVVLFEGRRTMLRKAAYRQFFYDEGAANAAYYSVLRGQQSALKSLVKELDEKIDEEGCGYTPYVRVSEGVIPKPKKKRTE